MSNQYPLPPSSDGPTQYGAPDYGTTQYGAPNYGTTQYGTPNYGTTQYGVPDYGTTQYGTPGYGTDPAAVSYQQVSPTTVANRQQRRQSLKFIIVMLATILLGCAVYFLRDLFEYGTPLLMLRLAESAAGLVLALSCFPFGSILRRQAQPAYPSSSTPQQPRDMSGPFYFGMVGLLIAGVSLYFGLPAAMDLADGPQPRTVTSCISSTTPLDPCSLTHRSTGTTFRSTSKAGSRIRRRSSQRTSTTLGRVGTWRRICTTPASTASAAKR